MTTNYQTRLQELEARQAAERERLEREQSLLGTLPEDLAQLQSMAHMSKLYDRAGSLHFDYCKYDSLRKAPAPTFATALRLADVYAPVPLAIFRDGCVSVRTQTDADKALDAAEARMAEGYQTSATVTPIAPFWIEFHPASYSQEMHIHHIGQTPIGLIEFQTEFPIWGELARKIASVKITHSDRACAANDYRPHIARTDLAVAQAVHVLGNAKANYLRFGGSDDRREPGHQLLYWDVYGDVDGDVPTLADLGKAIGEVHG